MVGADSELMGPMVGLATGDDVVPNIGELGWLRIPPSEHRAGFLSIPLPGPEGYYLL